MHNVFDFLTTIIILKNKIQSTNSYQMIIYLVKPSSFGVTFYHDLFWETHLGLMYLCLYIISALNMAKLDVEHWFIGSPLTTLIYYLSSILTVCCHAT